jgi:hypothetical protein
MMTNVFSSLAHKSPDVDCRMISMLRVTMGEDECRELVDEVSFEVIDRLSRIEKAVAARDFDKVKQLALGIVAFASRIGLQEVVVAAHNLSSCADTGDQTALSAVGARLMRVGEKSLYAAMMLTDDE